LNTSVLPHAADTAGRAPSWWVDIAIVLIVGCAGTAWGIYALEGFRKAGGRPSFYQSEVAPAVMSACGRTLHNPEPETLAAMSRFLAQQVDSVDCDSLPAGNAVRDLGAFQRTARYLELAVSTTWRFVGVSWTRLSLLHGLLAGAVCALSYAIFRLGLTRWLSVAGTATVFLSTPNLNLVPHLRDYAKGPFLLAVILIMGLLVVRRNSPTATLTLAAAAGASIGIGLGFRTDLMIAIVPVVVVLAVVCPGLSLPLRGLALISFVAAFLVSAYPILGVFSKGNNVGPVALLGLTAPFDTVLGIQPAVYEYGAQYNDSLIFSIVNSYAVRVEGRHEGVDLASDAHAAASMQYLGAIVRTFPADFVTRSLAAVRETTRYFLSTSLDRPAWANASLLRFAFWLRGAVSSRLAQFGLLLVIAATLLVSVANLRAAWLIVIVLAAFAGGSAIQFHERHIFYLQLVPWWALGFLVQTAFQGRAVLSRVNTRQIAGAAMFALSIVAMAGAGLVVTRAWQRQTVTQLFESYTAARHEPLEVGREDVGGAVRLSVPAWSAPLPADAPRIATRFLAVSFDGHSCRSQAVPVTLRYTSTLPELDFSETIDVDVAPSAPPTLFIVAFDRPDETSRFRGIEVDRAAASCVAGVSEVRGLERTPLLLNTTLAANWRDRPLHQRLR
jgi:hypothetical protein